ncbi:MAG: hypothetical protein KA015_04405 [Spirochaetes bacterium]|nr:hypothetical protein [Spirochaetota bacterium]
MSSIQDKLIAILGILSGLLAIAIPLITYIFGLRPMKEAEKRFNEAEQRFNAIDNKIEDKVKEKFDLYIKEKEYSKMNDALHNLTSIDPVLKQSAINYVIVNQDFIIDEYLASLIYHILEPNNTESTLRSALQTLLSSNDNIWAKKYFKKLYDIKDPCCYPNSDYVSKYLSRYYSKEISDFIISFSKDRFINFNYISTLFYDPFNLPGILPDYINDFLNNKEYIDLLDLTERSRFKNIIISYSNKYPFQYQETYLFTKHND